MVIKNARMVSAKPITTEMCISNEGCVTENSSDCITVGYVSPDVDYYDC